MQDIIVSELAWKVEYYTWTNKQIGDSRICSRIDRAFGNHEWMMKWGQVQTEYALPQMPDHTPMLLTLTGTQQRVKSASRFFNVWAEHTDFMKIVRNVWKDQLASEPMENIWKKLKALKEPLKNLNRKEFKGIEQKISKAREDV